MKPRQVQTEETALLPGLERTDTPKRSAWSSTIAAAVLLVLLLSVSTYAYNRSARAELNQYGSSQSPPPPRDLFHADLDTTTGLTNIYGVDSSGNYRLFARGEYLFNVSGSMWNYLNVENVPSDNDEDYITAMRAIGHLEGWLTCEHMREYYLNFMHDMFEGAYPSRETQRFLQKNYDWVKKQADDRYKTDDYWLSVKVILAQLEGILSGLKAGCPCVSECSSGVNLRNLDNPHMLNLLLLNADGDLYQITEKYTEVARRRRQRRLRVRESLSRRLVDETASAAADPPLNRLDMSGSEYDNHCSALIKLLPGHTDLLIGHDTWDSFESASPRAIKRFRLHTFTRSEVLVEHWGQPIVDGLRNMTNVGPSRVTEATVESRWGKHKDGSREPVISDLSFSSSPGFIASIDDFYITSGGYGNLMVTETSLDLYSPPLVNYVHPESVLCWMRSTVANSMAKSGPEWSWWFSIYHSGTYVNQWMVVDMNLFSPNEPKLQPNLFTVLEEMPAFVHSEDQTALLQENSYWASFNLPFYPDIFEYSGAGNLCRANPKVNCFDTDPRYQLFKAHQENVTDLDSFMDLMTSNHYQTDPLSRGDPCNAISCRQDLESNPWIRDPFGAIDSKVSSLNSCTGRWGNTTAASLSNRNKMTYSGASKRSLRQEDASAAHIPPSNNVLWARNGPTYDSQTPFCWSTFEGGYGVWKETGADFSHAGHPDCFHFPWQSFPPSRYA